MKNDSKPKPEQIRVKRKAVIDWKEIWTERQLHERAVIEARMRAGRLPGLPPEFQDTEGKEQS